MRLLNLPPALILHDFPHGNGSHFAIFAATTFVTGAHSRFGKVAQLVSQLSKVVNDVNGDKPDPSMAVEPKIGLLERAEKLATSLTKVADGK